MIVQFIGIRSCFGCYSTIY